METPRDGVITFPAGLPGFEACRQFVLAASPSLDPFTCVQGLDPGAPAFLAIDPRVVSPEYACVLAGADRLRLGAAPGDAMLWLAIVTPQPGGATVNLRAPIVVNPARMLGMQIVAADNNYAIDAPLAA